jgi:adenylate cyclase
LADVFISYERSTESVAHRAADALTRAGHTPWFDSLLPAYRDYSEVIEERLKATDVVLVLWSQTAHQSQWVRAEADYARQEGKLVQAVLDKTLPPMPFNRIQCANLDGWTGSAKNPQWRKVLDGIDQLVAAPGRPAEASAAAPAAAPSRSPSRRWRFGLAAALAIAVIAAVGLWFGRGLLHQAPPPGPTRIAILPFDTVGSSQAAKDLADGLTDQILTTLSDNHFQVVSHDDAATLRGADRDKRVADLGIVLLFDGVTQSDGKTLSATVHLDDPRNHVTLWSGKAEAPVDQAAQLQAHLAASIVGVLACSNRALAPVHGLSDPTLLTRYLRACDIFVNQYDGTDPGQTDELVTDLHQVTSGAPDFTAAHSDLAEREAYLAPLLPPEQAAAVRADAASEADRALALDPHSSDAYLAKALLLPLDHWADREAMLRRAVAADPDWPHANGFLGQLLADTGRMSDAAQFMHRAASVDLQIDWRPAEAWIVGGSGQGSDCVATMTQYLRLWPNDPGTWLYRFDCLEFAGRWDDALAMLNDASTRPAALAIAPAAEQVYLNAMKSGRPADKAEARTLVLPAAGDTSPVLTVKIQTLSTLGFVDDAFAAADRYVPTAPVANGTPLFLFFTPTAPMRRDPRFIKLAARLGLVDYWRTTGHWPDFCSDPSLPYNCKAEAAKLTTKPA